MEKTSKNDSIDHSGKSKSNFYRNLKVPGENLQQRNTMNSQNPRELLLRTQTANFGGGGQIINNSNTNVPNPPIIHQRSTNFDNFGQSGQLRRQISFMNNQSNYNNSGLNSTAASLGLGNLQSRAYATQSGGLPPLFVGFLTNEASMGHVQFMLDT